MVPVLGLATLRLLWSEAELAGVLFSRALEFG